MIEFLQWLGTNLILAPYHMVLAILNPGSWLNWSNGESLARFIYYGGSVEFFFAVIVTFIAITALGMAWKREILWTCVRGLEWFANGVGRTFAWAGLVMVLIQVLIVFVQRIFLVAQIEIGFFGITFSQDLSWWADGLKLWNALVVCLCVSYTFVQGGHVRVDLVYSAVSFRTKRMIDMIGSIIFMMPAIVLTYMYSWFFLWRHLVLPGPSASTDLERMTRSAAIMRWNVETIGFSPNGFNAYFLFKILLVAFCVLVFLQAVSFFWRSYLEWVEGEESDGKYLDKDVLGDEAEELEHAIHSGST